MKKTSQFTFVSILICMATFLPACSDDHQNDSIENDYKPIEITPETRSTIKELADFNQNLLKAAIDCSEKDNKLTDKSVVVSPLSASMLLSMVANLTEDDSRTEILDNLGVNEINSLNNLCRILIKSIPTLDKRSNFVMANSIWFDSRYELSTDFARILAESYLSHTVKTDFSDTKKVADLINDWAAGSTANRITGFIDEIPGETTAILANTIYFDGQWMEPYFSQKNTVSSTFHGLSGDTEAEMMQASIILPYSNSESAQYLMIPFGNGAFSLEIILPGEHSYFPSAQDIAELRNKAKNVIVAVKLPKFSINTNIDLRDVLRECGFSELLKPIPLTGFNPKKTNAICLNQKSFFKIDEKGVEAASASSGMLINSATPPSGSASLNVDRPFYFMLTERSTGVILLSGRIADL